MRGFKCPKCEHSSRDHTNTTCNHCGKCDGVSDKDKERFYRRLRKEAKLKGPSGKDL